MSEVKRYNGIEQDDDGAYVYYDDYAALAARVESTEKDCEEYCDAWEKEKAENKRLREAITELRGICGVRTVGWEIAQEALEASDEG